MYPFTTHCRPCWLKPRSFLIDGRAMLRIDASRMSMNWTRLSRSRIATPRLEESDAASDASVGGMARGYVSAVIGLTPLCFVDGGRRPSQEPSLVFSDEHGV